MKLDDGERRFLDQRRRLVARWRIVGWVMLAAIGVMVLFMYLRNPMLVNPWLVMDGVEAQSIPPATLGMMAILLPVIFLVCCFLIAVLVIFQFGWVANERRLLEIVDKLEEEDSPD
jgi:hypothetical protein